ncbi:MAG: hypothetical protein K0S44_2539 [Bacteroidetes bacterium]|jgi:PAS domain S-box-containing protein|nr:hypothetical protein [Bacteroidota bacterium]
MTGSSNKSTHEVTAAEVLDQWDIPVFKLDLQHRFVFYNKATQKLFKRRSLQGVSFADSDFLISMRHKKILSALNNHKSLKIHFLSQPKSRWYSLELKPCKDGMLGFCADIHEKKLAAIRKKQKDKELIQAYRNFGGNEDQGISLERAKEQEAMLKEAERIGMMGYWQRNPETGVLVWSDELYRIYGLSPGDNVISTKYFLEKIVHPDDKEFVKEHIYTIYTQLNEQPVEYRIKTKDGVKIVYSKPQIAYGPNNEVIAIRGIVRDITAQKKVEEEILNLKLLQQKEILKTILLVQESERNRIGESLHNGIGQLLYAIKLKHESLSAQLGDKNELLKQINKMLAEAITETRNISFELVPLLLKDFGLAQAIQELAKKSNHYGLKIKFNFSGLDKRLSQELEMAIYRNIQELLNNVIKHSKAKSVSITFKKNKKALIVIMKDNGVGFEMKKVLSGEKGFGLRNIRSRIQLFNGELSIVSEVNKGTTISMSFTLSE